MKHIITIFLLSAILTSCGNNKEQTLDEIIATNDVQAIQKKRDEIATKQQALNEQLQQLDTKIAAMSPEANLPLITSFKVKEAPFYHFLELQGSVATDQNMVITPEMGGVLTNLYVKEGQRVSKGQVLAKVDDGGMGQQLAQMEVQADLAKTTYERQEKLWNQKIGSEIQYLQTKAAYEAQLKAISAMEKQLSKVNIRAPFSGTIDDVITEKGSVVAPGQTPIMRVVSLKNMHIATDVPETYINDVVKGKKVEVFFPVLSKTLEANVGQTGNYINPNNRTYKIEIDVPNKDQTIKPNLTARLKINDYTNEKAILIPQSIISENAEGAQYIYTLKNVEGEKAVAQRIIIKTGKKQGDVIEVVEGLKEGDFVVEEGARSVKDGQMVKIITY